MFGAHSSLPLAARRPFCSHHLSSHSLPHAVPGRNETLRAELLALQDDNRKVLARVFSNDDAGELSRLRQEGAMKDAEIKKLKEVRIWTRLESRVHVALRWFTHPDCSLNTPGRFRRRTRRHKKLSMTPPPRCEGRPPPLTTHHDHVPTLHTPTYHTTHPRCTPPYFR